MTLIGILFVVIVVLPGFASLGSGIDFSWQGISIHHHSASRLWGYFFILMTALFALWPRFRQELLDSTRRYDAQADKTHRKTELLLLAGIAAGFGFLKIWQSRHLLTGCWDHGIYLNVMWNIAHGHGFWSSFRGMNFLGDHFNLILGLLAIPFRWFAWPSWPLLAQTLAMVGAVGLAVELARDLRLAAFERLLLIVFFSSNLYFQTVHAFDMHPIAFAPLALLAAYLLSKRGHWAAYYCLLPFALFGIQEDVPLIFLGLALSWVGDKPLRKHALVTGTAALVAFWLMVHLWIPAVGGPTVYGARYLSMGGSVDKIGWTFIHRPWVPLSILFVQGHIWPLLRILLSFGFLPLVSGFPLLGLLPPVLQQSLCDYEGQYGYGYHYSSNVLGFLMIGTVVALARHRLGRQWILPSAALLMSWFALRAPVYMIPRDPHLVQAVEALAAATPLQTRVAVQNTLGVPFALRSNVYRFPDSRDAELIVLAPGDKPLPATPAEFEAGVQALRSNPMWKTTEEHGLLIFQRLPDSL